MKSHKRHKNYNREPKNVTYIREANELTNETEVTEKWRMKYPEKKWGTTCKNKESVKSVAEGQGQGSGCLGTSVV